MDCLMDFFCIYKINKHFFYIVIFHRNQDPKERKEYVKMHDDVIDAGGDVKIFSSLHVSGERELIVHTSFKLVIQLI